MIRRLLIANRGEIAVRVARTAHRLGIETVGVYSEPDRNALHTDVVDQSVALQGSKPSESYLRSDAVIAAALDTAADAIHPGYGFLAENADFAQAVIDAGLVWVGPMPEQIRILGNKITAKRAAVATGVSTTALVEVGVGEVPDDLPLPALVKAAAGGGGRGMRLVRSKDELAIAIAAASREAEAAFGDGTVFIEPFVERGRHIEVQILGDLHGNVVHLGERECSIQRRNQKILEEAPAPGLSDETRHGLLEGALALARHVGYSSAGTVEFLVDEDERPTFLEVNTRLQVEHPVTEAVTGLDLVELQLRVASGEPLPMLQEQIHIHGHAIEARLVAEDPAAGWLPSTGRLARFDLTPDPEIRVDTGFRVSDEISADYDSLLAKIISHSDTRKGAAVRLARTLKTAWVAGVRTNCESLAQILVDPDFLDGRIMTTFLDDHPAICAPSIGEDERMALLLGATFALERSQRAEAGVARFAASGWRNLRIQGQRSRWLAGDEEFCVEYVLSGPNAEVLVGPWPGSNADGSLGPDTRRSFQVRLLRRDDYEVIEIDGRRRIVQTAIDGDAVHTHSRAGSISWRAVPTFIHHDSAETASGPVSPLPGTVVSVHVEAGSMVRSGDLLAVVEAMKMEHRIHANAEAIVTSVHVKAGQHVDTGELLFVLESLDEYHA